MYHLYKEMSHFYTNHPSSLMSSKTAPLEKQEHSKSNYCSERRDEGCLIECIKGCTHYLGDKIEFDVSSEGILRWEVLIFVPVNVSYICVSP